MNKLFDKADIANMSPITQKLNALLKAEDFSLLNAGQTIGDQDNKVNNLEYMRNDGERVYIFTHELPGDGPLPLFDLDRHGLHDLFKEFDEAMETPEEETT
jgi:hypothetical protein